MKKTQKALQKEQAQQAELDEELKRRQEELMLAQKSFGSLQEELEYKTARLERLWAEYNEVQDTLNSCQEDFDRERNDMFDTIYELTN